MKDIIDHIRYQEADTQSSEALLYQIAYMIREWKATRLIAKPEVCININTKCHQLPYLINNSFVKSLSAPGIGLNFSSGIFVKRFRTTPKPQWLEYCEANL